MKDGTNLGGCQNKASFGNMTADYLENDKEENNQVRIYGLRTKKTEA